MADLRIADIRVTPIAFYDPPLLNNVGCHQPFALRSIIEVETEDAQTVRVAPHGHAVLPVVDSD